MDDFDFELIEIFPKDNVFFEDYPLAKLYAEVSVQNISQEKIVFRVIISFMR